MERNISLHKANATKNDEFFTRLTDIERELSHYKDHFQDKIVFCNCDDPEYSNFWKYFQLNFHYLGLKKLVSTHYETDKPSYKMEIVRHEKGVQIGIPDFVKTPLKEYGDFRRAECIEILKEADIVVTNPPFSLFREYVAQLVEYDKKFIIIGNKNAISYKEFFPLLMKNKLWIGYEQPSKFFDGKGNLTNQVQGLCRWFINLDISKRHEELFLYKNYTPEEYPNYDNYDAIEVSRVADIPIDYDGYMGVPITFLDKYNPEQFEIYGATESEGKGFSNELHSTQSTVLQPLVGGVRLYKRLFVKHKSHRITQ